MDEQTKAYLIDCAIAAGLGLFIGLEREHSDVPEGELPADEADASLRPAGRFQEHLGVRTFALLSLFGCLSAVLAQQMAWFPIAAVLAMGGLLTVQYHRTSQHGVGITTEVAAMVTFGIGLLVPRWRFLAVAIALGVTLLLISKPWVRSMLVRVRRVELTAALQLAIVLAIVLPLLPTEAPDPWGVLRPRKIGLFVTLIASIGFIGYVLTRALGPQRSIGLVGVFGGLASSTAVTAAMASESRRHPATIIPGQLATFLANTVMCGRVIVITAVVSRDVARTILVPLLAMGLVLLLGAGWKWAVMRRQVTGRSQDEAGAGLTLRNPFALLPALKWGLILSAILVISEIAKAGLGDRGLLLAAAVAGLADVDAISIAVSRQSAAAELATEIATLAITIAVVSNTVLKSTLAFLTGGKAFGFDVFKVFGLSITAALAAALAL